MTNNFNEEVMKLLNEYIDRTSFLELKIENTNANLKKLQIKVNGSFKKVEDHVKRILEMIDKLAEVVEK